MAALMFLLNLEEVTYHGFVVVQPAVGALQQ